MIYICHVYIRMTQTHFNNDIILGIKIKCSHINTNPCSHIVLVTVWTDISKVKLLDVLSVLVDMNSVEGMEGNASLHTSFVQCCTLGWLTQNKNRLNRFILMIMCCCTLMQKCSKSQRRNAKKSGSFFNALLFTFFTFHIFG